MELVEQYGELVILRAQDSMRIRKGVDRTYDAIWIGQIGIALSPVMNVLAVPADPSPYSLHDALILRADSTEAAGRCSERARPNSGSADERPAVVEHG